MSFTDNSISAPCKVKVTSFLTGEEADPPISISLLHATKSTAKAVAAKILFLRLIIILLLFQLLILKTPTG
jgi:hypothetical protein